MTWIGHNLKCYHCISLLILKVAKHLLPCLQDKSTWLSGKLWSVKWMFHDTIQMTGISCLIHNIPLPVRDKKIRKTDKSSTSNTTLTKSNPVASILTAENPQWNCSTLTQQKQDLDFFFVGRKILSRGTSSAVLIVSLPCTNAFHFLSQLKMC